MTALAWLSSTVWVKSRTMVLSFSVAVPCWVSVRFSVSCASRIAREQISASRSFLEAKYW